MKCNSKAFTIIELLVVAGIIFILASLLLSSLSISKEQGRRIVCLNNLKNLQLAWLVYTNDNEGKVVNNNINYPIQYNWVQGTLAFNVEDNTNIFLLVEYENSMLGRYTQNYKIYKCPSDRSISIHSGKKHQRVRSYSLNHWIGGEEIESGPFRQSVYPFKVFKKIDSFTQPSNIFTFIDELSDSIDDGQFMTDMTGRALNDKYSYIIYNFPAFSHNKRGAFAFIDGHVENHKWVDFRTISYLYNKDGKLVRPINHYLSKDVEFLMEHATENE